MVTMVTAMLTAILLAMAFCHMAMAADVTPDVDVLKSITLYGQPERRVPLEKEQRSTNVSISVLIAALYLNLNKMQAEVNFFLRQQWHDPRLNYTSLRWTNETSDDDSWEEPYRVLRSDWFQYIWHPDIFIPNAQSTEKFDTPVTTVSGILYANGTVTSDTRMRAVVNCPVDTYKFLSDSQFCRLQFESLSYTEDQVRLYWKRPGAVEFDEKFKAQKTLTKLSDKDLQDCTTLVHSSQQVVLTLQRTNNIYQLRDTVVHSCQQVVLTLQRTNNIYVTQVYFPSTLTVFLSWLSFWVDREAILARVSMGSLCVVTIMTHATGLLSRLPDQAGIKAIDVWELVCVTLIFLAMLEFAAMHAMLRRQQTARAARKLVEEFNCRQEKEIIVSGPNEVVMETTEHLVNEKQRVARSLIKPRWWQVDPAKIDTVARRLFPAAFLVFNVIYWSVYTS